MKKTLLPGKAHYPVAMVMIVLVLASPLWPQESSNPRVSAVKEKSPNTAFLWSLLGTTVPYAASLAAGGTQSDAFSCALGSAFLVGPSLGFFYAGLVGRGLLGMGIRSAGVILMAIGTANLIEGIFGEETSASSVTVPFYAGTVIWIGSIVWDLATVKSAVRKRNEKMRNRTLALAPFFNPRTRTAGLSLQFSF